MLSIGALPKETYGWSRCKLAYFVMQHFVPNDIVLVITAYLSLLVYTRDYQVCDVHHHQRQFQRVCLFTVEELHAFTKSKGNRVSYCFVALLEDPQLSLCLSEIKKQPKRSDDDDDERCAPGWKNIINQDDMNTMLCESAHHGNFIFMNINRVKRRRIRREKK